MPLERTETGLESSIGILVDPEVIPGPAMRC